VHFANRGDIMSQKETANVNRDFANGQTIETVRRLRETWPLVQRRMLLNHLRLQKEMPQSTQIMQSPSRRKLLKNSRDAYHGSAVNENQPAKHGRKAVIGSANTNENLQNFFLKSELNIMQGKWLSHRNAQSAQCPSQLQMPPFSWNSPLLATPPH
jgi:hypothetical protein